MATQTDSVPGSGSGYGNTYIDALVWGCGWEGGPVTYWFGSGAVPASASAVGSFTGKAWTAAEMAAFDIAIANYEAVCGLQFEQAASQAEANAVWWLAPSSVMGSGGLGMHEVPDASSAQVYGYFNYQHSTWSHLTPGGFGYITVIHELGHGMGLAHPHDGGGESDATRFPGVTSHSSLGTYSLNQGIWTTMSYNDGWSLAAPPSYAYGYQASLMAFDIAALQAIYGANMSTRTGNDTYQLPASNVAGTGFSCIWDAGGSDTISNAGSSVACTINLNAAPLTGSSAGGYVSRDTGVYGGYTIANGALIENATGGSGRDTLVGNTADNVLNGGAGNDTMSGGLGNDSYLIDSLGDVIKELTGEGTDTVYASFSYALSGNVENIVLTGSAAIKGTGSAGNNSLTGNGAANQLNGAKGDDVLAGGGGADTLTGGRGADIFRFDDGDTGRGTARDTISDFRSGHADRVDLSAMDASSLLEGDQAFTYIGGASFSGVAGQLRFTASVLSGDLDGNRVADFEILLSGVSGFSVGYLVL